MLLKEICDQRFNFFWDINQTKYAYDGSEIIAELDESNNVLARYTHSGLRTDDVLGVEITSAGASAGLAQTSGTYLYLKDGLGSVQAITDESGNVIQRYVYSSFGKLLKVTDNAGSEISPVVRTSYSYTNRELDEETGLYCYRARYYDAHSGRFMQEDPHPGKMSSPVTHINKYIYTSNNPINLTDPSGLFNIGRELGHFFRNEWVQDIAIAVAAIVIIGATGGGGAAYLAAAKAVAATAAGSALASGAMAAFQGGSFSKNFSTNFHVNFRISVATLTIGALVEPWGAAGANTWYQGGIETAGTGGVTIGSSSVYSGQYAAHEAGHTLIFIGTSAMAGALWGNKSSTWDSWGLYLGASAIGLPYGGEGTGDINWWGTP